MDKNKLGTPKSRVSEVLTSISQKETQTRKSSLPDPEDIFVKGSVKEKASLYKHKSVKKEEPQEQTTRNPSKTVVDGSKSRSNRKTKTESYSKGTAIKIPSLTQYKAMGKEAGKASRKGSTASPNQINPTSPKTPPQPEEQSSSTPLASQKQNTMYQITEESQGQKEEVQQRASVNTSFEKIEEEREEGSGLLSRTLLIVGAVVLLGVSVYAGRRVLN